MTYNSTGLQHIAHIDGAALAEYQMAQQSIGVNDSDHIAQLKDEIADQLSVFLIDPDDTMFNLAMDGIENISISCREFAGRMRKYHEDYHTSKRVFSAEGQNI